MCILNTFLMLFKVYKLKPLYWIIQLLNILPHAHCKWCGPETKL